MHAVVASEYDDYVARYKASMYYSRNSVDTGASMGHSTMRLPKWGQELLMLYREPPLWSQAQLPPITKVASRLRSLEELASVDRTNERARKDAGDMREILSKRYHFMKRETDGSCDGVKASTRRSAPRNPFAVPLGKYLAHMHGGNDAKASAQPHVNTTTKSIMAAPPRPWRALKPISSVAVPTPPDSSRSLSPDGVEDSRPAPRGPRRSDDSTRKCRPVSLQVDQFDQRADLSTTSRIGRSAEGAGPAAARKRPRAAGGSKRQSHDNDNSGYTGFDWSSWGMRR
ncbi:hypothetical protein F5148DRAFT_768279 [Russula earlei]|uniref:Uncharacterized protein n=1 Tax=Russula earlei TaxID=71964 RepID=A0ACC0UCC0_9AGAM|nr:hypothetical protein F5148DRAFT_768279 [Russula earlei]